MRTVKIGDLLKVKVGDQLGEETSLIKKGDVMKVIGIYPNIIMVEKVKGYHLRRCYPKKSWFINLEVI